MSEPFRFGQGGQGERMLFDPDSMQHKRGPQQVFGRPMHASSPSGSAAYPAACLPQPYPPAVATCPSESKIRMIRSVYCGMGGSELSSTMQYFYQSMVFAECSPQLSKTLTEIAACEMRHMEYLGQLLCSMQSPPTFYATRQMGRRLQDCWWNSAPTSVNYSDQLRPALCANLEAEKKGITSYQKIMQQAEDEGISCLLERILLDEEEHVRIFTALLERFCG